MTTQKKNCTIGLTNRMKSGDDHMQNENNKYETQGTWKVTLSEAVVTLTRLEQK